MRVLLTNTRLDGRGGTESFMRDLARGLERRGHTLMAYGSDSTQQERLLDNDVMAVAIYAVPASAADLMRPWYPSDDPAIRDKVQTLFRLARERFARHAKWFGVLAERGRVVELSGAHHLFLSNPPEVLQEIETFAASLPRRP